MECARWLLTFPALKTTQIVCPEAFDRGLFYTSLQIHGLFNTQLSGTFYRPSSGGEYEPFLFSGNIISHFDLLRCPPESPEVASAHQGSVKDHC